MRKTRASEIPPFLVMDVLGRAQELERQGHKVIHMEIGEPDFPTPAAISEAAIEAIRRGDTHYTSSVGILPLRETIAEHYAERYGVKVDPDSVIVTMGTSPAFLLALCSLINPADEVIISNPAYACYPNYIRYIDGVPVDVPIYAEEGFVFDPARIRKRISDKTMAILINSPSNPTGCILPKAAMAEIAALGPHVISDEVYHGLAYGEKEHSILEFTDRAFVLNGFSKLYAMTGWRLGYIIAPKEFIRPIEKTQQNFFISPSSISQQAGLAALTMKHPELEEMIRTYDERRKYLIRALPGIGFKIHHEPRGAFYVLADARHLTSDSKAFAFDILEKINVAVTPGIDFGSNAEGFIRFSYANSLDNIKEACARLGEYVKPNP